MHTEMNIMSTQLSRAVTSGGTEIPESSSKLRHGHLRHDSIHTIVGATMSSNAMDAQARAARLVRRGWCGLNHVEYDV